VGDCFSSIAASQGLPSYHDVYDDGANADLKKKRPNPNMLVAGDVVTVPDLGKQKTGLATTLKHKFVVKPKQKVRLRILLVDKDDKGVSKPYKLTIAGTVSSGTTGADGLIEVIVDPSATAGSLLLDPKDGEPTKPTPSKPPPAVKPEPKPPHYPLPIVQEDFIDKDTDYVGDKHDPVEWSLSIGGLPSPNDVTGVQARLENLGFSCGGEVGTPGDKTKAAVTAYQKKYGLTATGSVADIQDNIRDKHDKV
jgi:hypothetical protein